MIDHAYFLNTLWFSTKDTVLCLDEDGTIQCANRRARDTFAWSDDTDAFGSVDDLHMAHEDGRPFGWQDRFSQENSNPNRDEVLTCRSAADAPLRFEADTSLVKIAEKSYLFCRLTNVTQQLKQEQDYWALKEKLHNFFYLCPSTVCVTEMSDGRIYQVNESLIELSGYSQEELLGSTTLELGFWTRQEDREQLVQQLQDHGEGQVEAVLRTKSGQLIEGKLILG